MVGVLDLFNGVVSEKTQLPQLPSEYMTVFSGRTDTSEVRCDLTDKDNTKTTRSDTKHDL